MVFPDFTRDVQRRRVTFVGVKRRLREVGQLYGMLFPARLRVVTDKGVLFFTTAAEASLWMDNQYPEINGEGGSRRQRSPRKRRERGGSSPTEAQVLLKRRKVIEVVASLSSGGHSPLQAESEQGTINDTDSEQESEQSQYLEEALPIITPGTSEEII